MLERIPEYMKKPLKDLLRSFPHELLKDFLYEFLKKKKLSGTVFFGEILTGIPGENPGEIARGIPLERNLIDKLLVNGENFKHIPEAMHSKMFKEYIMKFCSNLCLNFLKSC